MGDVKEPSAPLADSPAPRRRGSRKHRLWGMALSIALTLGAIAFLGLVPGLSQAQAASGRPGVAAQLTPTGTPGTPWPTGTPHQCGGELTVKNVTNRTITVTRADGTTATIYVTSGTRYTQNGHSASLAAIKAGSKLYVIGACQGKMIKATAIQIVG